jgi:hypothetical protein
MKNRELNRMASAVEFDRADRLGTRRMCHGVEEHRARLWPVGALVPKQLLEWPHIALKLDWHRNE